MQASKITINDVVYAVRLARAQGFEVPEIVRAVVTKIVTTRTNNGVPSSVVHVQRYPVARNEGEYIVEPDQVLDDARKYAELMEQARREEEEAKAQRAAAQALRDALSEKLTVMLGVPVTESYMGGLTIEKKELPALAANMGLKTG